VLDALRGSASALPLQPFLNRRVCRIPLRNIGPCARFERASGTGRRDTRSGTSGIETAIVLTCPWHRRDAETLTQRYDAPLYVPPPDEGDPSPVDGTVFREGDRLPVGVEVFPGMEPNDLVLWVESHGALVAGDTLQDRGNGLQFLGDLPNNVPEEWAVAAAQARESMQPLLSLPVEIVLLTHGAPTDRAALEGALATSPS
jgi:glyoxylase-like metal-dependent hydrolase (beta-lactamase superfamily II)